MFKVRENITITEKNYYDYWKNNSIIGKFTLLF